MRNGQDGASGFSRNPSLAGHKTEKWNHTEAILRIALHCVKNGSLQILPYPRSHSAANSRALMRLFPSGKLGFTGLTVEVRASLAPVQNQIYPAVNRVAKRFSRK